MGPPKKDPKVKGVQSAAVQAFLRRKEEELRQKGMYVCACVSSWSQCLPPNHLGLTVCICKSVVQASTLRDNVMCLWVNVMDVCIHTQMCRGVCVCVFTYCLIYPHPTHPQDL